MAQTTAFQALEIEDRQEVEVVHKSGGKKYVQLQKSRAILLIFLIAFLIILVGILVGFLGVALKNKHEEEDASTKDNVTTEKVEELKPGPEPYWKYRLPTSAIPEHYDLVIHIDVTNRSFSGNVDILFDVVEKTTWLLVNSMNIDVSSPVLKTNGGNSHPLIIDSSFDFKQRSYYVIRTKSDMVPGKYILSLKFKGIIKRMATGLFWDNFKTENGDLQPYASTQFESMHARKAFPCFDEPAFKATFSVTILHEAKFISLSNMPIQRTERTADGLIADHFIKSVKMPTYLVVFAVGEFKYKEIIMSSRKLPIRVYCHEELLPKVDYALNLTSATLEYFEKNFQILYSLPKLDMIVLPNFRIGGMENWGLITYSEKYILYDPLDTTDSQKLSIANIISHELAHQWFGNLVTMDWWDNIWLNEGFATFYSLVAVDKYHPDWQAVEEFLVYQYDKAYAYDSQIGSYPVIVPVTSKAFFGVIPYKKGSCMLRLLQGFLGDDIFKRGILKYLNKNLYGSTVSSDLWSALTEFFGVLKVALQAASEAGRDFEISQIMDTWTKQINFPVVNVKVIPGTDKVQLTQERFLVDANVNVSEAKYQSPYDYVWRIPFTYSLGRKETTSPVFGQEQLVWINSNKSVEIELGEGKWIKGNWGQYGYYIVNYEEQIWRDISKQLKTYHKAFPEQDRGSLFLDAFYLGRANRMSYELIMELTSYLSKEDDLRPLQFSLKILQSFKQYTFRTSSLHKNVKQYLVKLMSNKYQEIGFQEKPEDKPRMRIMLRNLIIETLCSSGYQPCLDDARKNFLNWKHNGVRIPPNLREKTFFYGISEGNVADWDFLFNYYSTTNIWSTERRQLLVGLAGSKETYLQYSLDPTKILAKEKGAVLSAVANNNPIGRRLVLTFLQLNVANKTNGLTNSAVASVSSGLNSEFDYNQVTKYFTERGMINNSNVQKSLMSIRDNIDWREKHEKVIDDWLQKWLDANN